MDKISYINFILKPTAPLKLTALLAAGGLLHRILKSGALVCFLHLFIGLLDKLRPRTSTLSLESFMGCLATMTARLTTSLLLA